MRSERQKILALCDVNVNSVKVTVVNLKVNDSENVDSYAIIVTFMSANKSAYNMHRS